MQCPNDGTTLQMTTREGIEIDYCPQCRGVWLDRGELDKLIERSQGAYGNREESREREHYGRQDTRPNYHDDDDDDEHYGRDNHRGGEYGHKKKKEGFLGDLFDF